MKTWRLKLNETSVFWHTSDQQRSPRKRKGTAFEIIPLLLFFFCPWYSVLKGLINYIKKSIGVTAVEGRLKVAGKTNGIVSMRMLRWIFAET
jgi:hypothetical protein